MKTFSCRLSLFVGLLWAGTLTAYDFEYDAGDIEGEKDSTGITYTLSVSKGDLGTSYDFDTKEGVTSGAPSGIDISVGSGGATGTMEYTNDSLPTSNFTISMNGKLVPPSGGSGTQPTWGARGNAKAPFHIKSDQNGGEKDIIVPHGTSVKYSAYQGTSLQNSTWSVTGFPSKEAEEIRFNKSFWTSLWPWSAPNITDPEPGVYNISATAKLPETGSDSGRMTVVGVDRIEKIAGDSVSFWNNLSNASTDYLLCIETKESLALKAFPKGHNAWPDQQPVWSSSGSWLFSNHITGNKDGVDQVTINTSEDNDNFTVTVSCGTSSKAVAIKTFKYQFRVNVTRASNNEPINIGLSDTFNGFRSVGHAWWNVGVTNSSIKMENIDLPSHQNADYIGVNVGYYPQGATMPPNFSAAGELRVNDNNSAERYREKELTRQEFVNVANYTKGVQSRPGTYVLGQQINFVNVNSATQLILNGFKLGDLIFTGASYVMNGEKNCVTVAKGAASAAGISLGNTVTDGQFNEVGITYHFIGNSPLAMYGALQ
ncbi:MAG: hypothetical protein V8T90_07005 [Victivallales bacterium]